MLGFRSRLAPFASAQLSSRPQLRISRSARASRLLRRLQPASGRPSLASGLRPSPAADPLAVAFELAINPRLAPRGCFQPSWIGLRQSCGNRPARWPPSVRLAPRVRCQLSSREPSALYLRLAPSIHLRTRPQLALSSSPPAPPPGLCLGVPSSRLRLSQPVSKSSRPSPDPWLTDRIALQLALLGNPSGCRRSEPLDSRPSAHPPAPPRT